MKRKIKESPIGERFAATLLSKALSEGWIERPVDWRLYIDKLKKKNKRESYQNYLTWRERNGLDQHTHQDLSIFLTHLFKDNFSKIKRDKNQIPIWNFFGCSRSMEDYNLLVLTTNQKPLFPNEEEDFKKYFYSLPHIQKNK